VPDIFVMRAAGKEEEERDNRSGEKQACAHGVDRG
jgi:hypothetical protein